MRKRKKKCSGRGKQKKSGGVKKTIQMRWCWWRCRGKQYNQCGGSAKKTMKMRWWRRGKTIECGGGGGGGGGKETIKMR